jgi:hypothetical protein
MNSNVRYFTATAIVTCLTLQYCNNNNEEDQPATIRSVPIPIVETPTLFIEKEILETQVDRKQSSPLPKQLKPTLDIPKTKHSPIPIPAPKKEEIEIPNHPRVVVLSIKKVFGVGCPIEWVQLALKKHSPELTKCYEDSLTVDNGLNGQLDIHSLLQDGEVLSSRVAKTSTLSTDSVLAACVLSIVDDWHFRSNCSMEWNASIQFSSD